MSNMVKLNLQAFRAYRQTPEAQAAVKEQADRMAELANAMSVDNHAGKPQYDATSVLSESKGSIVLVSTSNTAARVDNGLHNTLLKAVR